MPEKERFRDARPLTVAVSTAIRGIMREHKITQVAFAEAVDRDQAYISERVNAKRPFTTDEIDALADLIRESPRDLLAEIARRARVSSAPTTVGDELDDMEMHSIDEGKKSTYGLAADSGPRKTDQPHAE